MHNFICNSIENLEDQIKKKFPEGGIKRERIRMIRKLQLINLQGQKYNWNKFQKNIMIIIISKKEWSNKSIGIFPDNLAWQ